jgi:protein phosphatase 2C family protein 2/3
MGSSTDGSLVTFSIACESLRPRHCSISHASQGNKYVLRDLSEGKPGVWIRLRPDRGIPVDEGSRLDRDGVLYQPNFGPSGNVDGFVDYPSTLLCFRSSGDQVGVPFVFSKSSSVNYGGDVWVRLSPSLAHRLHVNDQFRFAPSGVSSTVFEVRRFSYGSGCAQGIRPTMEDEEVAIDDLVMNSFPDLPVSWYGCYDGHGSHECSQFLKKNLHKLFQTNFPSTSLSRDQIAHSLVRTFVAADTEFTSFARQRGISPNVGAVVVVVTIIANTIFCANLGDARAILARGDGSLLCLSNDMKPNNPQECERIKKCGGQVVNNRVNGRLAVSRAIGDLEFKPSGIVSNIPEIRAVNKQPDDEFIVIACDGLFDVMTSEEVVSFVRLKISTSVDNKLEPNPKQIAIDLVTESIMKRNTSDNVTVMVILLKKYCN